LPKGLVCKALRLAKRFKRWSVLLALTIEGYLNYIVFQGSITADLFVEFVEERVLPCCNLYPRPQLVLILDNASIHKDKRLKQLCNEAEVLLLFLPPYSLDFNPIEATFKDLKA
jgi:transposase